VDVFSWGGGGGEENSRTRLPRRFHRTTRVPNNPVYVIHYMLSSGGFTAACRQTIAKSALDLDALDRHVRCSSFDNLSTCSTIVKGLFHLVPSRTPRSSGYGVLCTCSLCYVISVVCLVEGPPQETVAVFGYIEGSFLEIRTGDARERHGPNIYSCMST